MQVCSGEKSGVEALLNKITSVGALSVEMVRSSPPVAFMTGMCASAEWEEIRNKVHAAKIMAYNAACERNY